MVTLLLGFLACAALIAATSVEPGWISGACAGLTIGFTLLAARRQAFEEIKALTLEILAEVDRRRKANP